MINLTLILFFSSRRRHTRLQGDWSSDVCSSDLVPIKQRAGDGKPKRQAAHSAMATPLGHARVRRWRTGFRPARLECGKTCGGKHPARSGEGRVGEEGRCRGGPDHLKKKKDV